MIVVRDIVDEVQSVIGRADPTYVFSTLTRAVQTLANKSTQAGVIWDPLLVYVDIPVADDYYVYLPAQVEKPIQVNLNRNPSFARAQFYEFGLNGPGSTDQELGWQWQDRGWSPLQQPLPAPPTEFFAQSDDPNDASFTLNALLNNDDASESWVTLPIDGNTFSPECRDVIQVVKPVTAGNVSLIARNGTTLAVYPKGVTFPRFGVIKLSQRAVAVRMLCRRRTAKITSLDDVIPLHNEMAVILMCNAIKMWKEQHWQDAEAAEAKAMAFLEEEQRSRNTYMQMMGAAQDAPVLNFNILNRDSIVVGDVIDRASELFGPIGTDNLFDRITSAIEMLANLGPWDPLIGYADIAVAQGSYFTLPRAVETILALNVNGHPGEFKSRWFEFHLNGPGSKSHGWCGCGGGWSDYGEVCIAFDPVPFAPLAAYPYDWRDSGKQVVVYGTDANGVDLVDPDGTLGYSLTISDDYSTFANGPVVARFDRIEKDPTLSFVQLATTDGVVALQSLSTYYPDETVPVYKRIRLNQGYTYAPNGVTTLPAQVRIRYRKRWGKIASYADPIPLRSRVAMDIAMQALKQSEMDPASGRATLEVAKQYLAEQWRAVNPLETAEIQMKRSFGGNFYALT